ncbi:hypothetical protein SAMN04489844_3128 [Nocardioides exalbidus]|uniref:Uncharacterized protein n=1 Tax=Nocardioides exalbidus TaxID=402596 RepID=A0A1H4VZA5_9ACTN|nr:DUF5994 family protein [Nocardioides exalbidus]SEC85778.1 hypothetical protein SAMN04489844_3128 [Nocardioides exalbidus]
MTTPHVPVPRGPLRLRMGRSPGQDVLDGGWWPQSRDLQVELADLIDHFPDHLGRVTRAVVSPPDWDLRARAVAVSGRYVKIESFPRDDMHLVVLTTSRRARLRLLVVPHDLTDDQGEEALLAAATHGNAHPARELLDTVTEHPDVDPRDYWTNG